jgi:hypothetical protein
VANPQKVRKIPLRKCVVTNEQHPKMEMFRIVRTPENKVVIDLIGKEKGHGAYVSKSKEVIQVARKKKILNRYLEVEVPDEIFTQLEQLLKEGK